MAERLFGDNLAEPLILGISTSGTFRETVPQVLISPRDVASCCLASKGFLHGPHLKSSSLCFLFFFLKEIAAPVLNCPPVCLHFCLKEIIDKFKTKHPWFGILIPTSCVTAGWICCSCHLEREVLLWGSPLPSWLPTAAMLSASFNPSFLTVLGTSGL